MKSFNMLDWIALCATLIGALNWGLVGLNEHWNMIQLITMGSFSLERVASLLIGLSALWLIYTIARKHDA